MESRNNHSELRIENLKFRYTVQQCDSKEINCTKNINKHITASEKVSTVRPNKFTIGLQQACHQLANKPFKEALSQEPSLLKVKLIPNSLDE